MNTKNTEVGYIVGGTTYGQQGAEKYASTKHGPDGAKLLDPYFLPFIRNSVQGKRILDAGCGAGPWAIEAAKSGAKVDGIDIQKRMIEIAHQKVEEAGLSERISLQTGDVNQLPYANNSFDKAISINVACNLPSTNIIEGTSQKIGLGPHLSELARVLKENGRVILTTTESFEIIFTAGKRNLNDIMIDINQVIKKINSEDRSSAIDYLNSLDDVYRAVFMDNENGNIELVTDVNQLKDGCKIWHKLPGMTVPNIYHSPTEYVKEIDQAGFHIINTHRPKFDNKNLLDKYNAEHANEPSLHEAYVNHNIFVIYELEKKSVEKSLSCCDCLLL